MPIGFCENATVYNHGSNGFLGRAAAVIGNGDLLYDTLCCLLPYDQQIHPVQVSQTAPYAVVNHWLTAAGIEGQGGSSFFTGSISVAMRNIYSGLVGFRPSLDGILMDPVIPADWKNLSATCCANDITYELEIRNESRQGAVVKKLLCDGIPIETTLAEKYRVVGFIPDSFLSGSKKQPHKIEVIL